MILTIIIGSLVLLSVSGVIKSFRKAESQEEPETNKSGGIPLDEHEDWF